LNDGFQLSPSLTTRLGCDADIIPAFLDGSGAVIDLGRARRLFTGAARTALEVRDRGCAWPGCNRSISWCQPPAWIDLDRQPIINPMHHPPPT